MAQIFSSASEELFHPMLALSDSHIIRLARIVFRDHLGLLRIPPLDIIHSVRQFHIQFGNESHITECPELQPWLQEVKKSDWKVEMLHLRDDVVVVDDEIIVIGDGRERDEGRPMVMRHPLDDTDPILKQVGVVEGYYHGSDAGAQSNGHSAVNPALLQTNSHTHTSGYTNGYDIGSLEHYTSPLGAASFDAPSSSGYASTYASPTNTSVNDMANNIHEASSPYLSDNHSSRHMDDTNGTHEPNGHMSTPSFTDSDPSHTYASSYPLHSAPVAPTRQSASAHEIDTYHYGFNSPVVATPDTAYLGSESQYQATSSESGMSWNAYHSSAGFESEGL